MPLYGVRVMNRVSKRENEMRSLVLTISLVAMTGVAFAGEPQKSTPTQQQPVVASLQRQSSTASLRAPQKMTDQQLSKVVAGSNETNQAYLVTTGNGTTGCILPGQSLNGFRGQSGSSAKAFSCQF
jgi:hypothetical protein